MRKRIVFTDEKDFTEEVAKNRQNDRAYGIRKKDIPTARRNHESSRTSKKVMVSAGVSWNGKTRIHFIDTKTTKEILRATWNYWKWDYFLIVPQQGARPGSSVVSVSDS